MIFTNDIAPVLFELGPLEIRWYSLMFAAGLVLNYLLLTWIFKREKYPLEHLESLVIYLFIGLVVGARLGHIIFYELDYYLANPIQIPQIWNGGLASHGGAIGLLIALYVWNRVHKIKFSKYVDAIVVPMPLTAAFVRIGNFFNSEIVGHPTDSDYGVVFNRLGEDFPRHPAQLYEGFMSLLVFVVMLVLYRKYYGKMPNYFFVFTYLFLYFGGRFVTEFWKDVNSLPDSFGITTGQLLSLIPVAMALVYFGRIWSKKLKA